MDADFYIIGGSWCDFTEDCRVICHYRTRLNTQHFTMGFRIIKVIL